MSNFPENPFPEATARMSESTIRFATFPMAERPQEFVPPIVNCFRSVETEIATELLDQHIASDEVLRAVSGGLIGLGFEVETGKRKDQKVERPVFWGENGMPTLKFEVDAFHSGWNCALEVEATRAIRGGAVYRDLIQALVMDRVEHLCIAVPNLITWGKKGTSRSKCYRETVNTAQALYGHGRIAFPYRLIVIGY